MLLAASAAGGAPPENERLAEGMNESSESMEREKTKRVYVPTRGEEVANTLTHGVMSLVALAALPFAAVWAYVRDPEPVVAAV